MVTTDGTSGSKQVASKQVASKPTSKPVGSELSGPGRGRTAAQQRVDREAAGSPEALARDIEQTREDLAETFDAIAEKVSPKRVAKRTTQKAAATLKQTAASAKVAVASGTASAKEAVAARKGKVAGSNDVVALPPPSAGAGTTDVRAVEVDGSLGDLPPVSAVEVPELGPLPGAATPGAPLRTAGSHDAAFPPEPLVKVEYVAVGAAGLLVTLVLLVRWRRRR